MDRSNSGLFNSYLHYNDRVGEEREREGWREGWRGGRERIRVGQSKETHTEREEGGGRKTKRDREKRGEERIIHDRVLVL